MAFPRSSAAHTLKFGVELSFEQVNVNPDAIFNGTFVFDGYQTGSNFADFLIGAPNQFNQQDSQALLSAPQIRGLVRRRIPGGSSQILHSITGCAWS